MSKLLELKAWRLARFEEPRPSVRVCMEWARNGEIPAVKRGRSWFIDTGKEQNLTGNDLVDSIL